jgi:hypothetical protein
VNEDAEEQIRGASNASWSDIEAAESAKLMRTLAITGNAQVMSGSRVRLFVRVICDKRTQRLITEYYWLLSPMRK